jgi:hypothetical protein
VVDSGGTHINRNLQATVEVHHNNFSQCLEKMSVQQIVIIGNQTSGIFPRIKQQISSLFHIIIYTAVILIKSVCTA